MKKIGLNSVIGFMIGIVADMFIFFSLRTRFTPFVLDCILIIGPFLFAGGFGMSELVVERDSERDCRREVILYIEIILCVLLAEIVLCFTGLLTSMWVLLFHGLIVTYVSVKLLKPRNLSLYEPGVALLYSMFIVFALAFYSALVLKGVVVLVLLLVCGAVYLFQTA